MRKNPKIFLHKNDLPEKVWLENKNKLEVAIDTEAMGLSFNRDRLCLVQLTFDKGETCHLVQITETTSAPVLTEMLSSKEMIKIFHFARFDVGILFSAFGVMTENIFCTKIASKLARTYTERHGLKTICKELLNIDISKTEQSSDWGKIDLTEAQKSYAAADVVYLSEIKEKLSKILIRESRMELANECFSALVCVIRLDCLGWSESLFSHI